MRRRSNAVRRTARPDRPLGPADCLETQFSGQCSKCGAATAPLHVPTRLVPGKSCERCYPACNAQPSEMLAEQPKIDARDPMTAKLQRFAELSPARQKLVRMCQTVNYGEIKGVVVRGGNPIYDPAPVVVVDAKLYRDDGPRPELALADFELRDDVRRLMARLDAAKNGMIQRIEVLAGLPRRVVLESPLAGP